MVCIHIAPLRFGLIVRPVLDRTYNMGMALESAALLYKATGDEKYLDMATSVLRFLGQFALMIALA